MEEVKQVEFDFTPSKIFSKHPNNGINNFILRMIPTKYPWVAKSSSTSLCSNQKELFITGTKDEIAKKIEFNQYMSCKLCERCGANIQAIPWHIEMTICNKCEKELSVEYGPGEIPWGVEKIKVSTAENANSLWWLYL